MSPHKLFTRIETNLYISIQITSDQALLGADITMPTLYGEEKYTVRSGTKSGTKVSFKAKGVPNLRNNHVIGDLIATLNVTG